MIQPSGKGETRDRSAWRDFVLNVFYYGDPEAIRQGADPYLLRELSGQEREDAIDMLIRGLKFDDSLAALGLRVMGATRAVPQLQQCLPKASPLGRVETALALRVLADDQQHAPAIIEVLEDANNHWSTDAAIALRHFNTPEAIEALYNALSDDRYLVRYHAAESLLVIHRVDPPWLNPDTELFRAITSYGRDEPTPEDRIRIATARQLMEDYVSRQTKPKA